MINTAEQTSPQAKTPWQYVAYAPVYTSTKLPRDPDRYEWKDFCARLGNAAWVWLVIVSHAQDTHAITREGIVWRIARMGGPTLTALQVKRQLAKLYATQLVECSDANVDTYRRRRRATGRFDRGRVQEHKAVGGVVFQDNKPVDVCLPRSRECRAAMAIKRGGYRPGAGRPLGKPTHKEESVLIEQHEPELISKTDVALNMRAVKNTVRFSPESAIIPGNQTGPNRNQTRPYSPAGENKTPEIQPPFSGTILALKIFNRSTLSSSDQTRPSSDQTRTVSSFPFSDEKGKRTLAVQTGEESFNFFFPEGEFVLRSDPVNPTPAEAPPSQPTTPPTPAISQPGKAVKPPAPAEGVKIQRPWELPGLTAQERVAAIRKSQKKRHVDVSFQPSDGSWRPVLSLWPTIPMPPDWGRLSTVDAIAAEYLVRMYTAYRDAKYSRRYWFKGKPQSQPWWPQAVAAAKALKDAGIPPVAWIAWVDGAVWSGEGPAPHAMVFSAATISKQQTWCLGTYEDYLFRPMRIPPTFRILWAEWKQAQKDRTANNPVVIERFRQLQEQAEDEAVAMQAALQAQVREGRWVW